uniref:hypothetical protein n=1 Tax=uncultured Erythrobacter sp. TaxID=263913 RepID=UPI0026168A66|nr:hypothetical protein [uncultured Erythrobacter sp.]
MDTLQFTFFAIIACGAAALVYILIAKPTIGNPALAAVLSGGFFAYTAVQIWHEGIIMFWSNHSANLTGIQVWWDLVMCVMIALFFIAPRARKVGMNVPLWALFVGCTASIGLLAMCARLFWLEKAAYSAAQPAAA